MLTNKKIIIFDLDGVLINSIKNMEISWNYVSKKYKLNIPFKSYKQLIGLPFYSILKKLKIKKNLKKIKYTYDICSNNNISKIKLYPNVKKTLSKIKKKNYKIAVITSKDKARTKKIILKFKLDFKYVFSPDKSYKPKPYPDQILNILKKESIKKKNCFYVGDMKVDAQFARNSGVKFIFSKYGYGGKKNKSKYKILNFKTLSKII